MDGVMCLQGGAEFGDACREMDLEVLRRAGGGRVVVVALAAAPGRDHDTAVPRAVDYYRSLGADAVGAPDARFDAAGAIAAVETADLVVLPGGSPTGLLVGITQTGVADAVAALLARGGVVSGASAGAMALCAWTVLPERGAPELVPGLGIVPNSMVLPHFTGDGRWLDVFAEILPPEVVVLGLPECSGLIVDVVGGTVSATAVGAEPTRLLGARDEVLAVGAPTVL